MKKFLSILLCVFLSFFLFSCKHNDSIADSYTTKEGVVLLAQDDYYYVADYIGRNSDIIIPEKVNGFLVLGIGFSAFKGNTLVESISLPNSIVFIDDYAFSGCTNLKNINIPNSVTKWGTNIVSNNDALNCTIKDNIKYLGNDETPYLVCVGGIGKEFTEISLTDSTKYISQHAFAWNSYLSCVEMPNTVEYIDDGAFFDCSRLENISLSNNIVTIGKSCFAGCFKLKEIDIPDSVVSMGDNAFHRCGNLSKIKFGASLERLGKECFMWCDSLKTIEVHDSNIYFSVYDEVLYSKDKATLYLYPRQKADLSFVVPDTVTHIDDGAFYDNKYLESVTLSASIKSIGGAALRYCRNLSAIKFNGTVVQWASISKGDYWKLDTKVTQVQCSDGIYK